MSETRRYSAKELEDLVQASRAPMEGHHLAVTVLISMSIMTEALLQLRDQFPVAVARDDWIEAMLPVLLRQVLIGTATVMHEGVSIPDEEAVH